MKSFHCTVKGCDAEKTELIPALGHDFGKWSEVEHPTCEDPGSEMRVCSVCEYVETRTVSLKGKHDWEAWETLTKPTCDSKGIRERICKTCSKTQRVTLDELGHEYRHVEVKAAIGVAGSEYDKCVRCGSIINMKTFKALKPDRTTIKSLKAVKKGFKVKWAEKSYTGYQIRYSLKSSMASPRTVTIANTGTVSKKVTKLKARKGYYVQVRTYQTVKGRKCYSAWSEAKYIKTK